MVSDGECVNRAKKRGELLAEFFLLNDFTATDAFSSCLNYIVNAAHQGNMCVQDFETTLISLIDMYKRVKRVGHES